MLKKLISYLNNFDSIAIFGYGKEGKSFENFAKRYNLKAKITILQSSNREYLEKEFKKADVIIKSPGISLYKLGIEYKEYNFTSITELFIKYFSKHIIGITGTKGKSTLSTLINNLFLNDKKDSFLCGNIGIPALDIVDKIKDDTIVVMELSSHQLYHINYSPHIAIVTNLFQDHLDYYKDLLDYHNAKFNILRYQKKDDIAIIQKNIIPKGIIKCDSIYDISSYSLDDIKFDIKQGFIHNHTLKIVNIIKDIYNIDEKVYQKTIQEFKTLPHRLEYVATIDGKIFINDSISTIPQATIEAIKLLKEVDTLILGGFDRDIDYTPLVDFLSRNRIQNIILFSSTGRKLQNLLKNHFTVIYCETLKDVVDKSLEVTQKGKIVLFSPAAASFGEFKNFEHRGEEFKKLLF